MGVPQLQCSFCGKSRELVKRLIAGPGVYICDHCVDLCRQILDGGQGAEASRTPSRARAEAPAERAAERLRKGALPQALESLSYRERRVVELLYGLSGEQPRTLDEVGSTFRLTHEQVREVESQSLEKLQSPPDRPSD